MKLFKLLFDLCIIVAAVSLIVGMISRVLLLPLAFGLVAHSFLGFSIVCLLFAIALGIRELVRRG
ncbi:hypothetical protein ACFLQL_04270 [Verrucomicrobiota bacterium]